MGRSPSSSDAPSIEHQNSIPVSTNHLIMCGYRSRLVQASRILRHVNPHNSTSLHVRFINNDVARNNSISSTRGHTPSIRPFPSAISIGTDICHVPRIQGLLTKGTSNAAGDPRADLNLQFLRRLFTDWELHHNRRLFEGECRPPIATARFLAGR